MYALRSVRAAVFAVVCVTVSLAMHVLAGGAPVGAGVLAGAMVPTAAGAFVLARRRRGFGVLTGAGFAAQYGMHLWFTAGAAPPPAAHEHGDGGLSAGLFMLLVHAVTALLSAHWLEREECGLATLLYLLFAAILTLLRPYVPAVRHPAALLATPADRVPLVARLLAATVSRRGPPAPAHAL